MERIGESHLRKCNLKAFLNLLEHLGVRVRADKRNSETLGAKTARTTDTVQV